MIIIRWGRLMCYLASWWVAGVGCYAGEVYSNEVVSLLMGTERSPDAVRWSFGILKADRTMTFSVEWGGCSTQSVPSGVLIGAPGQAMTQRSGEPQLPAVATLLREVKAGGIRVTSCTPDVWQVFSNLVVVPVSGEEITFSDEGPSRMMVSRQDSRVYSVDAYWPETLVEVQEMWRGTQRLVRVQCRLMQYNPVQHILRVTPRVRGLLTFERDP